jgi:hypothetical protein
MRTILRLNRKALVGLNACSDGLALFDSIKAGQDDIRALAGRQPRRSLRLEWNLVTQIWMATAYPGFHSWLITVGAIGPVHSKYGANLYGANLDGANLSRANLSRANLDGANLDGANLDGANLYGANLDGANLSRANLSRANLDGANLSRANLSRANLSRANLDGANLSRANLYGANLDGANLDGARWNSSLPIPSGWRLKGCKCCLERVPAEAPTPRLEALATAAAAG